MGLSAAFLSAVALMSCSSLVKSKSGVVLVVDGVEYTAEDLFNDQKTPAAAEAKFNAVYKVAVRAYFKEGKPGFADMAEVTNDTKIKISEQKSQAQSNADKNGTSYDEEWQKILDSNNVDDEQGLYDKFEYDFQKEKFENKLYDNNYDVLRKGGKLHEKDKEPLSTLEDVPGYLTNKAPYHIKHILIKLANAKAGDGVNAEISAEEAEKISGVIQALAGNKDGTVKSFEQISDLYNEDDSAKENHGSLGIMSKDTSFVNDFKLGIYLYESFFSSSTQGDISSDPYDGKSAKKALNLDLKVATETDTAAYYANEIATGGTKQELLDPTMGGGATPQYTGIGQIPYEEALNLGKFAHDDFSKIEIKNRFEQAGIKTDEVSAKYFPRNVIFNKYFNKHNIMVITPNEAPTATKTSITYTADGKIRTGSFDSYRGTFNDTKYGQLPGFNFKSGNSNENEKRAKDDDILLKDFYNDNDTATNTNKKVLRDNNGRVVLVFHSGTGDSSSNDAYQGIHFVVIERSPFIGTEYDTKDGTVDQNYKTDLEEYYTEFYPEQPGGNHPKYKDGADKGKDKHTFVNYINGEETKALKERSNTVKSELKKCTERLDTYVYDYLMKTGDIHFNDDPKVPIAKEIETSITDWIKLTRSSQEKKKERTWNETWQTYYLSLKAQCEQRKEELSDGAVHSRLIPEICAYVFNGSNTDTIDPGVFKAMFSVGGIFHD